MNKDKLVTIQQIQDRIFTFRDVQVMVDSDLAEMYQVKTKVLNQAVKRNLNRFPEFFRFQLTDDEKMELVTNCDRFEKLKHSSVNPYAFTEQGVAMLSAVLRSDIAINVSIGIMQAFVKMRKFISNNAGIFQRLDNVEHKLLESDQKFEKVFKALESKNVTKEKGILFNGQVFDAYQLVSNIIRNAKKSVVLIDNYIDDTVLTFLSKRKSGVKASIYTKTISKQLKLDLAKHNTQYPQIKIFILKKTHDRFLVIDETELYHFGASLKDLGKKWFAFSKMDSETLSLIAELNKDDSGE